MHSAVMGEAGAEVLGEADNRDGWEGGGSWRSFQSSSVSCPGHSQEIQKAGPQIDWQHPYP